jgi:hypothetical protein
LLDAGQPYLPFIGCCSCRAHRHVSRETAQNLIGSGQYRRVFSDDDEFIERPAIQRVGHLTWRKRMSRGDGPAVAVMQLVP